ncbi:MAG: hypothetical protein OK457_06755 [Thaumarchaeota archaeon]|nr:hypothetical protein [Nitrososphaerota archaeon]
MSTAYDLITTIQMPELSYSSDWAWIDSNLHRYYLTDRSNKGISVIDTKNCEFLGTVQGCVGETGDDLTSGPNGIVQDSNLRLWIGDGDSTLKILNMQTNSIEASIATGGSKLIDMVGFDPKHQIILSCNNKDSPPFVTFVSAKDLTILGKIVYPDAKDPEHPLWNARDDKFYLAIPRTVRNPGGQIDVIDPVSMEVIRVLPAYDTMPDALAHCSEFNLFVGSSIRPIWFGGTSKSVIIDSRDGQLVETIPQIGGTDEVWYNPGDQRIYVAGGYMTSDGTKAGTPQPIFGVVDAKQGKWLTNIPIAPDACSVAVDSSNNHIFVHFPGSGVGVFAERK